MESMIAFEVEIKRGQIVPETLKENPEALLRFSESLLKDVSDGKIYAVKLRTVAAHSKASYAIINVDRIANDRDLVLLGTGRPYELMRVEQQPEGDWKYCPVRGADRHPWRVAGLFAVWGKVENTVDVPA